MEDFISSLGIWAIGGFPFVWLITHILAKPATEVSIFGLKYTKRAPKKDKVAKPTEKTLLPINGSRALILIVLFVIFSLVPAEFKFDAFAFKSIGMAVGAIVAIVSLYLGIRMNAGKESEVASISKSKIVGVREVSINMKPSRKDRVLDIRKKNEEKEEVIQEILSQMTDLGPMTPEELASISPIAIQELEDMGIIYFDSGRWKTKGPGLWDDP